MSVQADTATAVTAAINAAVLAGTFAPWNFAAERTYVPTRELEEMQDPSVLVLASAEVRAVAGRGNDSFRVTIQTAVTKKIDIMNAAASPDEIDALSDLVEAINDELRGPITAGTLRAGWQETRRVPLYDQEQLLTAGIFQSVSEHDYLVVRTVP